MSDSTVHHNLVTSHPVATIHTPVPRGVYQAVADYSPNHDGELSINAGDIVSAVRPLGNGWSLGRNDSSSSLHSGPPVVGIFPSHCIVPLTPPSSQTMPSLPSSSGQISSTVSQPKPSPQREFQADGGMARNAFGDTVSQHQHCPECVRYTGSGGVVAEAASGSRVPLRRNNDMLENGRSVASMPIGCNRDRNYPDCCAVNSVGTTPKSRCDVSFVNVHRCNGSTGVAGTGCAACDGVRPSEGPSAGRHQTVAPEACSQVPCRSAGGRADRTIGDENLQQGVSGTAVDGVRSSSPPPSVTPRRPVPQPPKPHLIVKPTRDPMSGTDSPILTMSVDDRRHQLHEASHRGHLARRHREPDCADDTDNNEIHHYRNAACAVDNEDADEVQPAWCGWRTSGRDRRRSANVASGDRRSFPPPPPPTSAIPRDGECRLSTFLGQSDPNVRESLSHAMMSTPNHRHLYGGESDADNEQSLRRPCNSRYKYRPKRGCRHDQDLDPSVVFRRLNASSSVPELSFGLSPTRLVAPIQLRSPISGISSGPKTVLNSRTPRASEATSGRSGTVGHRAKRSQFATCWCRAAVSTAVALASGALTFGIMTFDLAYSLLVAAVCTALVAVLVGVALVSSNFCRCIVGLLPSTLSTARGRTALCLLAAHLLLGGPAVNITLNAGEAVRALTCSTELALNRTAGLMRPFDAMMKELDRTVARLEGAAADVSRGLRPLDEGLDAVEMDVYNARTQLLGTRRTCKNLVDRAFVACDTGIIKAQSQCLGVMGALGTVYNHARDVLDRINPERWAKQQQQQQQQQLHDSARRKRQLGPGLMPLLPAGSGVDYSVPSPLGSLRVDEVPLDRLPADTSNICEPLSSTLVCRGLNDSDTLCQPARWAGEAIQEAINGTRVAMRGLEDALKFRVTSSPYDAARSNANTSISVHHGYVQFQRHAGYFISAVTAVRCVLPAVILLILIYDAFRYVRSFLCAGDSFDNIYVGQAFVKLDRRRYDATGNRLLPLRKHERRHLIDATSARMSAPESRLLISGLCVVALCLACSVACCAFDYALYLVINTADDNPSMDLDKSREPVLVPPQRREDFNGDDQLIDIDGSYMSEPDSTSIHQHHQQQHHRRHRRTRDSITSRRPSQPAVPSHLEGPSTDRIVTGDGVVVDLLDVFVRGFRSSAEETSSSSTMSVENARTAVCVPVARHPSGIVLIALGVVHLLFTATVALKYYAYRLRPSITGHFYTERSMERAVHLYSVIVRRRRRLPQFLRRLAFIGRCRLLQDTASDAVAVGGKCAALLRRCDTSDVRCVVCWDRECSGLLGCTFSSRSSTSSTATAAGKPMSSVSPAGGAGGKYRYCSCGAVYCPECFVDVGRSCPLCRHENVGAANDDDETDDCEDIDECFSFDDDLNDVTYYDVSRRTLTHRWAEL